jgi:hypothetical protein
MHKRKKILNVFRVLCAILVPIFMGLSIIYSSFSLSNNYGIYHLQVALWMVPLFYLCYLLITGVFYDEIRKTFSRLRNKKVLIIFKTFVFILVFLFFDELWSYHFIYFLGNDMLVNAFNWSIRHIGVLVLFILTFKYGNTIEFMAIYNDIQAIYLITKNGTTIYGFDFQNGEKEKVISTKELIMGGVISVTSSIWHKAMNIREELTTMIFETITARISFGKYLIGIIFSTQNAPILKVKVDEFLEMIEKRYNHLFENWSGELSDLHNDTDGLNSMVFKVFR